MGVIAQVIKDSPAEDLSVVVLEAHREALDLEWRESEGVTAGQIEVHRAGGN